MGIYFTQSPGGFAPIKLIRYPPYSVKKVYRASSGTLTKIWSDKVQITLGTDYEARDQFRAALTVRGLHYETVTEIPFEIELVGSGSVRNMFYGCLELTTVPAMDTSSVTNMMYMFYNCSSLTTVPAMDTSSVTDMYAMFRGCSSLTQVPAMETWDVTDMSYMFYGCSSLTSVSSMGTSKVTNMSYMFSGCNMLTTVPDMYTWHVTDMTRMFYGCSSLTDGSVRLFGRHPNVGTTGSIAASGLTRTPFYVEQVSIPKATGDSTTARNAFRAALTARGLDYKTITELPFEIALTGSGNSVFDLFAYCEKLQSVPSISLPGVTSTRGMFNHCTSLTSVGDLQTSNVTNTMYMFWNCPSLTDGNVRLIGRHPNVDTAVMISGSGLTYLPFDTEVFEVTLTNVQGSNTVHPLVTITVPSGMTWSVRIQGTMTKSPHLNYERPNFRVGTTNSGKYAEGASVNYSGTVTSTNRTIALVTNGYSNSSFTGTVTINR